MRFPPIAAYFGHGVRSFSLVAIVSVDMRVLESERVVICVYEAQCMFCGIKRPRGNIKRNARMQ